MTYEPIRVLVETDERTFKGTVYKPVVDDTFRLSDHLNTYDKTFLSLSEVTINDRGQAHRAGEKADFVAVAVNAITFITPLEENV